MNIRFLLPLCFAIISLAAQAADMYRWKDEKGKTHFSDSVPEKYKRSAEKLDSRSYELNEAQLREKAERDAKKASAQFPVAAPNMGAIHGKSNSGSQTELQSGSNGDQTDCAMLRQKYFESQECFGRYRNVNGSIKAEAFQRCTVVQDPAPKCGPIITEPY